jgi:hypothetical protein
MRRLLRFLAFAALGLPHLGWAIAGAANCPPIVFGGANSSLDELAVRTLHGLLDEGGRYESGGFFIKRNGAYHASEPVTQHAPHAVNYCIVLPRSAELVGIYHTHVESSTLSARDRSNAERAGVPSYIGTIRGRSVLVYDARRREVRPLDDRANSAATTARARASDNAERNTVRERLVALKRHALALLDDVSRLF